MLWDRKHLFGYVETIQLTLGVTDKVCYATKPVLVVSDKSRHKPVSSATETS